jgi:predicted metal-dependent peptidase
MKIAKEKMVKARSRLVLDHCFWGMLALKLKMIPDESCETATTNGETLLYNPEYVNSLTSDELMGLEAHEVWHCALGHIWRMGSRDKMIANMAMDYVANDGLIEAGFTLPEGALIDPAYKGMSFEDVYDILMKKAQSQPKPKPGDQSGKQQGQSGGKSGGKGDPKGDSKDQDSEGSEQDNYPDPGKCGGVYSPSSDKIEEFKMDWKASVTQAIQVSQGKLPANLKKLLDIEVLNPTLPWYILLRDFVERTARNDYNWSKPSRRYLAQDLIMPGLISEELPQIAVVVDSSGSTAAFQPQFATEASAVLSAYKTRISLIYCDAAIQSVEEYETEDLPLKIEAIGYGGTDFRPPFEYIREKGLTPACVIYLTDLYGTFPEQEPEYPVMWVSVTPDKQAPWGETVPIKIEH